MRVIGRLEDRVNVISSRLRYSADAMFCQFWCVCYDEDIVMSEYIFKENFRLVRFE